MLPIAKYVNDVDVGSAKAIVVASAAHARIPAEKLRNAIKQKTFYSVERDAFKVTISAGVAELQESEESIDELINKADIALYEAKETGKDKSVIFEPRMASGAVEQQAT